MRKAIKFQGLYVGEEFTLDGKDCVKTGEYADITKSNARSLDTVDGENKWLRIGRAMVCAHEVRDEKAN